MKKIIYLTFCIVVFGFHTVQSAYACTSPTGVEGQMIYNIDYKVVQYCDGTNWIAAMDRGSYESGDCTNPVREEGAIIYNEAQNVPQVCIGGWKALGSLNASAGTGGCSNPTRTEGTVIYNETDKIMQYCDGSQYVRLQGPPPVDGCSGVSTIGSACPDGTIFAGLAPIGNVKIYTTTADLGSYQWNNGNNTGYVSVGADAESYENGLANQNTIIATDSDSGVLGKQDHLAAQACADLTSNGHDDWYLPSLDELNVLYINRAAVGGFNTDGNYYWSSTEHNNNTVRSQRFSDGVQNFSNKNNTFLVRCVRR